MLKSPKQKGKRGEYAVRDMLRGFGYKAQRTPLSGGIEGWKGDITTDFPWFIEVKNTAKTTFPQWYEKAQDQCLGKPPMIVWQHKGELYAFLLFSDFLLFGKNTIVFHQQFQKPHKKASSRVKANCIKKNSLPYFYEKKYLKSYSLSWLCPS